MIDPRIGLLFGLSSQHSVEGSVGLTRFGAQQDARLNDRNEDGLGFGADSEHARHCPRSSGALQGF